MVLTKKLTIIIVTFNSSKVIISCLEKINFSKFDCMVVDNASSDDTVAIVKKSFPLVKIIQLQKNIGYGRANNVGLHEVQTEFALILNPDAFLFTDDIEQLMMLAKKDEKIAIAAPLLLPTYPAQEEDKAKQLAVARGNLIEENFIEGCGQYLSVKYVIGAILLMRMSVFRNIGFFDENIFLYYEDDEISWRVVRSGHKAVILPSVFGFHIGHGSSGSSLRGIYRRFWHRALSKFYWKKKQKGRLNAVRSASWLAIMFLLKSIFYLLIFNLKKSVENFASTSGTIAFLIGLKAFDRNDNPRG